MMYKRLMLISFLVLINIFSNLPTCAEEVNQILIIYDSRYKQGEKIDNVLAFRQLLGHFNTMVDEVLETNYKTNNLREYDYIFVMGNGTGVEDEKLLKDLNNYKGTICWIGRGIDKYIETNSIKYIGKSNEIIKVYYNNGQIIKNNENIENLNRYHFNKYINPDIVSIQDEQVEVYSWLYDGVNKYPYIFRKNNFYFIAGLEFYGDMYNISSDILYNIFKKTAEDRIKFFIRIEDVHPFRNTEKLKQIADYLYNEDIPFIISLIPAYYSEETKYVTKMGDIPDFINTIKYMQNLGGSVILHGYQHSTADGDITGEGFEFWDSKKDQPIKENEAEIIHDKVYEGLRECVENGIYPLGFEAPHYAISSNGYKQLKKYFSTYCGQVQCSDLKSITITYPYEIYNTNLFNHLLPENTGYVDISLKNPTGTIKKKFEQNSFVRGYTGGMFFHSYLDIRYLKDIVEFLKSKNVAFYDLKQVETWVKCDDISIMSSNHSINVDYNKKEDTNKREIQISYLITKIVIFILIVLIIIYIISKLNSNKKIIRRK